MTLSFSHIVMDEVLVTDLQTAALFPWSYAVICLCTTLLWSCEGNLIEGLISDWVIAKP